jgi:hypothetical protein
MKSKSYFVDRIVKLRGDDSERDELMKLPMADILPLLNKERAATKKDIKIEFDHEEVVEEPTFISLIQNFMFTSQDP